MPITHVVCRDAVIFVLRFFTFTLTQGNSINIIIYFKLLYRSPLTLWRIKTRHYLIVTKTRRNGLLTEA